MKTYHERNKKREREGQVLNRRFHFCYHLNAKGIYLGFSLLLEMMTLSLTRESCLCMGEGFRVGVGERERERESGDGERERVERERESGEGCGKYF